MKILAIDPGNVESAYVALDTNYAIWDKGKLSNECLFLVIDRYAGQIPWLVIERIASYGMPVGRTVFDTCEWIGRFVQRADELGYDVDYVYRNEEKMAICHDARANDATIRRALIDRFARHDLRTGKGTKKNPDVFYGFAKDEWAAMAVGVTWLDRRRENGSNQGMP